MKGALEVNINTESEFSNGSEVLIHTAPVFPTCDDFLSYLRVGKGETKYITTSQENSRNFELDFKVIKNNLIIFPNPSSGITNFTFTKNEIPFTEIKIITV